MSHPVASSNTKNLTPESERTPLSTKSIVFPVWRRQCLVILLTQLVEDELWPPINQRDGESVRILKDQFSSLEFDLNRKFTNGARTKARGRTGPIVSSSDLEVTEVIESQEKKCTSFPILSEPNTSSLVHEDPEETAVAESVWVPR